MTELVVDGLEAVEVQAQHGQRERFTPLTQDCLVELIKEVRTICQAGQLVLERQAADIRQQSLVFSQRDELARQYGNDEQEHRGG